MQNALYQLIVMVLIFDSDIENCTGDTLGDAVFARVSLIPE